MKKKLIILGMVLCLLTTPLAAWADSATYSTGETVMPRYTYVNGINTTFGIVDGTAGCSITVYEKAASPFDYSKLTVYLKKSSGTTVKTWTATKYPSSSGYFNWSKTYELTARGSYYIKAVNKLYKNDSLVETITTTSVTDTY